MTIFIFYIFILFASNIIMFDNNNNIIIISLALINDKYSI